MSKKARIIYLTRGGLVGIHTNPRQPAILKRQGWAKAPSRQLAM